jgi:glycosyltransferase involved in cell wall biosynthesis
VLVFIVAYDAAKTIKSVLTRTPLSLTAYDTEVLIIDDASHDDTFEMGEAVRRAGKLPFRLTVLVNPINQGYGGNQKLGFLYAIKNDFDIVALVHGDGQYAPEALPELLSPLLDGQADAVFGSRMMQRFAALKGGMPFYKYVGNKILTTYQNLVLGASLSEFHSGYRLYSTAALRMIPFELNSSDFHFDTEIIIQLLFAGFRIKERPIPTYYGDEICYVNGLKYAWDVLRTTTVARLHTFGLMYRRKFDVRADAKGNAYYKPKADYDSSHSAAFAEVGHGQTVVDIGCASGYLSPLLKTKGCRVIGIDQFRPAETAAYDEFIHHDLDGSNIPRRLDDVGVVLLLDVIEHLRSPEAFVAALREVTASNRNITVIASTGNVGFIIPRLMLLFGQFNYGKRGILDLTHTRLFTFASFRRLFEESGFAVLVTRGIPAPIPMVVANRRLANFLMRVNQVLIRISKTIFAYQIFMVVRPLPTLTTLLQDSHSHATTRATALSQSEARGPSAEPLESRTG